MKHLLSSRRTVILRMSLVIMLVLFGMVNIAGAENIAEHTVAVEALAINELVMNSGTVTLTISTAVAGSEPTEATDVTCGLSWTTNETGRKITVASSPSYSGFTLTVQTIDVTKNGGSVGNGAVIDLSESGTLTLLDISESYGSCTLEYTLSVTAAQGTMPEKSITVTYTIT